MATDGIDLAIYGGCAVIACACAILSSSSERKLVGFAGGLPFVIAGSIVWCYLMCYTDPAVNKSGWWVVLGAFYAAFSLVFSVPAYLVSFLAAAGLRSN